ncbi:DUF6585 family protein [Nocardia blacklockiae]|uniref:DUF6585 family protein n=1 Tax=Nocardia blacklockiae TaxID=480036 RepID=UPI00189614B8|nr:DUF6585 family protein [Nocardia blacklockiae]MBF6171482.1 hypothetical protein [Nocardia blacklockiae]
MTTPSTQPRETGGTGGRRTVPLSQLIYLIADHDKLGEHRQTFQLAPMSGDAVVRGCALVAGGLVAVGALCAAAGSWAGCGAIGGLALVPAAIAFLRKRRNRGSRKARLDLFDHGVTVYRGAEDVVAFRWDTVEVRQEVIPFHTAAAAATEYAFTLTGPGPSIAAFDEHVFEGAREWGPAIQSAVTATQLPRVAAAIDAEETVMFGNIAVNLNELAYAGKSYPWEHIQRIEAQHGLVCIKVDGQWVSLEPVEAIPNFYIFNEVAERLRLAALEEAAAAAAGVPVAPVDATEQPADAAAVEAAAVTVVDSTVAAPAEPDTVAPPAEASRSGQRAIAIRKAGETVGVIGGALADPRGRRT